MEEVTISANHILVIMALIGVLGIIGGRLGEKLHIPDVVIFLFTGILVGPALLGILDINLYPTVNELILTFGSAFILYEGGREIKLRILNKVKITVTLLATLGVIISTIIIGFSVQYIFDIPFIYAILIGAIIASTDPASLIPVFKNITIINRLKQTVISESAFNDAAGAVLFTSILGIILGGEFHFFTVGQELMTMIFIGTIVGIGIAIIATALISERRFGIFSNYAPIISVLSVIFSYELAGFLHGSGYMAVFIAGLVTGNKKLFGFWIPKHSYEATEHFSENIATFCKMAIFIVLGTHVNLDAILTYGVPSLLTVLILIFVARPIVVLLCALPDRQAKWTKNELLFMMWVRETGVIPAALLGIVVSNQLDYLEIISSVVFLSIFVTLTLQASTTALVAKKLHVLERENSAK